jgi:sirohydrochlorin ferrochelatase
MKELAEPTIKEAFGKCVEQGASRIIVSPYFLSPGRHWKQVCLPSLLVLVMLNVKDLRLFLFPKMFSTEEGCVIYLVF